MNLICHNLFIIFFEFIFKRSIAAMTLNPMASPCLLCHCRHYLQYWFSCFTFKMWPMWLKGRGTKLKGSRYHRKFTWRFKLIFLSLHYRYILFVSIWTYLIIGFSAQVPIFWMVHFEETLSDLSSFLRKTWTFQCFKIPWCRP